MFASLVRIRSQLAEVAGPFDAGALAADEAVRVLAELGAIRRLVDGMIAKTAKAVADGAREGRDGAEAAAQALGTTRSEARSAVGTAKKLEALPATDAAVRAGELSAREAQMIADAATINPAAEEELLRAAAFGLVPLKDACIKARVAVEDSGARGKRQHAARFLRTWINGDGMLAGRFAYPPEIGGRLKAALDAQVKKVFREHQGKDREPLEAYAADALAGFVLGETADGVGAALAKGTDATVHILIDHDALVAGHVGEDEVCEIPGVGPVDVSWVRSLLGSAFLTAVIRKGKDIRTIAHLGRHVPVEIQTALLVMGRECDVEGCYHRGYLERDHTHEYAKGGPTAFWNLRWLCYRHHRQKTSGWQFGPPDPITGKRKLHPPANARHERGTVRSGVVGEFRRALAQHAAEGLAACGTGDRIDDANRAGELGSAEVFACVRT